MEHVTMKITECEIVNNTSRIGIMYSGKGPSGKTARLLTSSRIFYQNLLRTH